MGSRRAHRLDVVFLVMGDRPCADLVATLTAYYNEIDPYAAQWLRNLISAGHIAPGDVDERSIVDVQADDLAGYQQCHFFAGIGGWSYAARLAGWPDDRPLWTGSCPCQPFSVASVNPDTVARGQADDRHLMPELARLIGECSPDVVFGEQVANAIKWGWLDETFVSLEALGYACAAVVLPALAIGARHERKRICWVADAGREGWPGHQPIKCLPLAAQAHSPSMATRLLERGVPWTAISTIYCLAMGFPSSWNALRSKGTAMPSSRKSLRKSSAPTSTLEEMLG